MDYHLTEAEIARTVLGCGQNRLVITDHTKFNRTALVRVAGFSDFDLLVTDRPPPPDIANGLATGGARVEVAAGGPG
jgi:DeoR family glycerol-3-phosphate regulon repressor